MATNYNKDHHNATPHYNGNISALTTDYLTTGINPLVKFFQYDKLNRIKGMRTSAEVGNPQCHPSFAYSTYYTYDYNGNLDTLIRYDNETNELHYIEYEYLSGNNRLDSITAWWGLNTCGYRYDAIGNLIQDTGEELEISWNAAGKVDTIWKNGNVLSTFRYSATGQRQMKKAWNTTDYYIHDASGNVMCIYRQQGNTFCALERPIYGAKRLGELKQEVNLTTPTNPSIPPFTIGMRQYELTDHLGNVMATILDRRQSYSSGDSTYKPYIISTTDYYPFGYPIKSRSTNIGGYRYFFNGQEGDNEVFGESGLFAFEYRMHDARLGRFWSVDPLATKYPWNSTYAFCENTPIWARELEGLEALVITVGTNDKGMKVEVPRHAQICETVRNGATLGFSISHPLIAREIGYVKKGSNNISSVSGRIARHVAENVNMTTGEGSERNAFRHVLWSATIANKYGTTIASQVGNAHEGIPMYESGRVDFKQPLIQNLAISDDIVDFLNNEIGRNLSVEITENTSPVSIAKNVLDLFLEEGFWTVSGSESKGYNVTKHKISKSQYDIAIKELEKLDENGYNDADRESLKNE